MIQIQIAKCLVVQVIIMIQVGHIIMGAKVAIGIAELAKVAQLTVQVVIVAGI